MEQEGEFRYIGRLHEIEMFLSITGSMHMMRPNPDEHLITEKLPIVA